MLRRLTRQDIDIDTLESTRGVDACSVDVQTWAPGARGATGGGDGASTGGLSAYHLSPCAIMVAVVIERDSERTGIYHTMDTGQQYCWSRS